MESGIPNFKDWHELKDKKREVFLPNGKSFFRFNYYVKFEPVEKIFEGMNAFLYGKEIYRIWKNPGPPGEKKQNLLALFLEDGSWAVSVPFYEEREISTFLNMTEDFQNQSIMISVLTNAGWKSRIVKIK